jgi:hypothetical protein
MPSTLRSITIRTLPILVLVAASTTLGAQQSAEASLPIRIVVPPVLAIRGIAPAAVQQDSRDGISATSIVTIESNLPYRLSVRRTETATDARVFVRGPNGGFQPLDRGASLVAVARGTAGQQAYEITCRMESSSPDGCTLVYELSAEYHDMLIRTTATLPSKSNAESGTRTRSVPSS